MFIVHWDGQPPPDKEEWIDILKEAFEGSSGSYRILFCPGPNGWRFDFEWRADLGTVGSDMLANTPESMRFNLYQALVARGKPVDPDWRA